jgi:hypothetical protein
MKPTYIILSALLVGPLVASAGDDPTSQEIAACTERNLSEPDTIRAVRIVARDRSGSKKVTVAKFFGRRTEDGRRQQRLEFLEPVELRGTQILLLEGEDENEIYLKSSEINEVKRIHGLGRAASLFESDFTYEDFEHLQGFKSPGQSQRLEDTVIGDRSVYVIEKRPDKKANSSYESIISFVDKQTCIPLRIDFYEPGDRLRKELIVDSSEISKRGSVWIAHAALLRDVRDHTTTTILVASSEQRALPAELFSAVAFQRGDPPVATPPR